MARKEIKGPINDNTLNNTNHNFKELYDEFGNVVNTVSDKTFDKIVDSAKLNWKEPVSSQSNLPDDADEGDTRMARDTGKVYRFDGYSWKEIQKIDAGPVNEVDTRLTSQLAETERNKADKTYAEGVNKRIDNLVIPISPENANVEVTDAHVSIPKDKQFDTIGQRIEEIESDIPYKPMSNLVENGDFSRPLEGWDYLGPTVYRSILDGRLLLDYDSPSMLGTAVIEYNIGSLKLNDKIYMALDVEHQGEEFPNSTTIYLRGGIPTVIPSNMTDEVGKRQRISRIQEINEEPNGDFKIAYRDRFDETAKNSSALIDNVIVINLTDAFGAGNEPTLSEMNDILGEYPNSWFDGTVNLYNLENELIKLNTLIEEGGRGMQGVDATTGLPASPSYETDANGYSALRITDATPYAYDELNDKLKVVTNGYDEDSDSIKTTSVTELHTEPIDIFPQQTRTESPDGVVVEVPKGAKGYMVYAVANLPITGDVTEGGFRISVIGQLGTGGSAIQWYRVGTNLVKSGHRNLVIYSYPKDLGVDDSTPPTANSETLFVSKVVPTHLRVSLVIEGVFEEGEGVPISVKVRWLK